MNYRLRRGNVLLPLLMVVAMVAAIPATVYMVKHQQGPELAKAANNPAQWTFITDGQILPPQRTVHVMLDAGTEQIGFVRGVITFDPTKIQLSSEITPTTALKSVLQKTSMDAANTSGEAIVVLALDPQDVVSPPTGKFEVATFTVKAMTAQVNATAMMTVDAVESEIANISTQILPMNAVPVTFIMNQVTSSVSPITTTSAATAIPSPTPTLRMGDTFSLGFAGVGTLDDTNDSNFMEGSMISVGEKPFLVRQAKVISTNLSPAPHNKFSVAIYGDKNGKPDELIVSSSPTEMIRDQLWQTTDLNTTLVANRKYWVMYNSNGLHYLANLLKYSNGKFGQGAYSKVSAKFESGWPQKFGPAVLYGNVFSMYLVGANQ